MIDVQRTVVEAPFEMLQHREEIVPFGEWILQWGLQTVLEIGTGPGGTTFVFCSLCPGEVISIDLPSAGSIHVHDRLRAVAPNFSGVLGDSQQANTAAYVAGLLNNRKVDLLFIDGDHGYEGVRSDYQRYRSFVRGAGWVAFHDINASEGWGNMGVPKLWSQLEGTKIEFSVGADWGGIGAIQQ